MHRLGLSPQKPLRRAYERDEKAVKKWVKEVYPRVKKYAKKKGAEIFWLDEATIRSDDPLQRTWGEKGHTPVVHTSSKRQAINAISALSNSGGFWYHVFHGKFTADKCIECFKKLLRNLMRQHFSGHVFKLLVVSAHMQPATNSHWQNAIFDDCKTLQCNQKSLA